MATLGYNPAPSNFNTIGFGLSYGAARLGSSSNATYAAASLGVAPDHVYRLGISSGNLNLPNTILTDSGPTPNSADLEGVTLSAPHTYSGGTTIEPSAAPTLVNPGGTLGSGNVTINPGATLILNVPNAYSSDISIGGTLIVAGAGQIPAASNAPVFQLGGTPILGDVNASGLSNFLPGGTPINLNNSNLELFGNINQLFTSLSFTGDNWITIPANASLQAPNLTRNPGVSPHSIRWRLPPPRRFLFRRHPHHQPRQWHAPHLDHHQR